MRYERLGVIFGLFLISSILFSSQTLSLAYAVPGQGKLYGIDASNQSIFEINPATGLISGPMNLIIDPFSGPFGGVTGLAADPISGQMYIGTGSGVPEIYSVDPTTGVAAEVCGGGTVPLPFSILSISDLDFDSTGTLFASVNIFGGSGGSDLATIDLTPGPNLCSVTFLGPYVLNQNPITRGLEAIAFDANDVLFGGTTRDFQANPVATNSDGTLYMIDWTSLPGTALLAPAGPINQLQPQAGVPTITGGLAGLQMDCGTNPILYGGTAQGRNVGGADLVTLNIGSGFATDVNGPALTINGPFSLSGLAYDQTCPSGPGPSPVVGGELLSIDTAALLVAGAQTTASWMIALALSVGIGAFVIRKKFI